MTAYEAINPECQQGKHANCDLRAMCRNPQCDGIHRCDCFCHPVLEERVSKG